MQLASLVASSGHLLSGNCGQIEPELPIELNTSCVVNSAAAAANGYLVVAKEQYVKNSIPLLLAKRKSFGPSNSAASGISPSPDQGRTQEERLPQIAITLDDAESRLSGRLNRIISTCDSLGVQSASLSAFEDSDRSTSTADASLKFTISDSTTYTSTSSSPNPLGMDDKVTAIKVESVLPIRRAGPELLRKIDDNCLLICVRVLSRLSCGTLSTDCLKFAGGSNWFRQKYSNSPDHT